MEGAGRRVGLWGEDRFKRSGQKPARRRGPRKFSDAVKKSGHRDQPKKG